nr:plasmid pRiA4b ORF-3 family protein [Herpetosiphon giganteus]
MRDADIQAKLAAVTRHERDISKDDSISQEQVIAMLIEEAHREMLAFQAVATPKIDSVDNQFPAVAMIDSAANQFRVSQRPTAATMAYQLVITIEEVTPRIWRRLVVTSETTLAHLHTYLQIAFEWDDYHLHEFRLHGAPCDDAMRLDQLYLQSGYGLEYVYDFGDYWVHTIEIEASTPINPRSRYPRCTGGAQPGPEEDSGGAYAYSQKLARSRRAKAAAKKRAKNAGGTSKSKKKRATSVRKFSQAIVNRRLAAFCAGDPWYASA